MIIKSEIHTALIKRILDEENLDENIVNIVDNPYAVALEKGWANLRTEMIGCSSPASAEVKTILIKAEISDSEQTDTVQRVCFPTDKGRKTFLNTPEKFIEHLVRHEIEHCKYGKLQTQEHEADEAALQKMNFIERPTGF